MKKNFKFEDEIQDDLGFVPNNAGLPMRGKSTDAHTEWLDLQMKGISCYAHGESCSAASFEEEEDQKDEMPDEVIHTSGNSPEAAATANGRFLSKTRKRA